jgi:hypothetical protein
VGRRTLTAAGGSSSLFTGDFAFGECIDDRLHASLDAPASHRALTRQPKTPDDGRGYCNSRRQ